MRPFVEKLITLAKRVNAGSKSARIRLVRLLGDRAIIPSEHQAADTEMTAAKRAKVLRARSGRRYRTGEPAKGMNFTAESVVHRLVTTIAPSWPSARTKRSSCPSRWGCSSTRRHKRWPKRA